jgi:hypothetical protein
MTQVTASTQDRMVRDGHNADRNELPATEKIVEKKRKNGKRQSG